MSILLLILGIVLIVAGVAALLRRELLWGVVLVVVGVVLAPSSFAGL
ncbi:MAG TPA: GPGG-motif small membrane protein [Thermobifida alba]|nr:GPGG-motif small membrane protein [Thermobifida alba]